MKSDGTGALDKSLDVDMVLFREFWIGRFSLFLFVAVDSAFAAL